MGAKGVMLRRKRRFWLGRRIKGILVDFLRPSCGWEAEPLTAQIELYSTTSDMFGPVRVGRLPGIFSV